MFFHVREPGKTGRVCVKTTGMGRGPGTQARNRAPLVAHLNSTTALVFVSNEFFED
jgi:hypothetical protein